MILWLTGNTGAGKTTLANRLKTKDAIILDGNEMRLAISEKCGLLKEDRWEHNLRVARLAKVLENQGFVVIVSLICPYEELRKEVQRITGCKFIYLPGGKIGKDYPYEIPIDPDIKVMR